MIILFCSDGDYNYDDNYDDNKYNYNNNDDDDDDDVKYVIITI